LSDLQDLVREEALALGADFFGVADLFPARDFIAKRGGEMVAQFPRAVSIGVMMPQAVVDQIVRQDDKVTLIAYRSHSYDILNIRLNQIASRLAGLLQREGHRAFPIAAAERANGEDLYGLLSHKLAAHLAGLGWIGKSCLLVTPEVGPRVRWNSVLTGAPLTPGRPMEQRCGGCTECVDACPPHAFTGRNFCADEPREARYDVHKCNVYMRQRRDKVGVRVCGMCVYVCPYGRRKKDAGKSQGSDL
jgi:epoxyqueuosine reductase QueG